MYDAAIGRWISQDPLGLQAGDANLYRYADNNPTNRSDPSGQQLLHAVPWLIARLVRKDAKLCGEVTATWEVQAIIPGLYKLVRFWNKLIDECPEPCPLPPRPYDLVRFSSRLIPEPPKPEPPAPGRQAWCPVVRQGFPERRQTEERIEILGNNPGAAPGRTTITLHLPRRGEESCSTKGFQLTSVSIIGQNAWQTKGFLHLRIRADWDCCGADAQVTEIKTNGVEVGHIPLITGKHRGE